LGEDELSGSEVSTSVVKCCRSLRNTAYIIIRIYIDRIRFAAYMAFRFTIFFYPFCVILYHCTNSCILCMLLH